MDSGRGAPFKKTQPFSTLLGRQKPKACWEGNWGFSYFIFWETELVTRLGSKSLYPQDQLAGS